MLDYYLSNFRGDDEGDSGSSSDDSMSETTRTEEGALSQIGSSFKGMLVGLLCFVISWPVLYCGASRVHWSKVFKKAIPIEQAKEGVPAYLTVTPAADLIGDGKNLDAGKYLRITKSPEYYAYVEHKESETKEKREGVTRKKVKETTTTYSYTLEWTSDPKPISGFNQKFWDKHRSKNNIPVAAKNPVPAADEKATVINAPNCKIGNYTLDTKDINFYGGSKDLGKKYLVGKADAPKVGDKRLSYSAYPSDIEYTFAGALSGKKLTPYFESETESNLPAAPGNFNAMLAALKSSDRIAGILWFLGGWILMAAGLVGMVGPITTLLEFIPFLGDLGSGLIKVVLALVALLLSAIFWWVIKLWWLVLIVLIAIAAFLIYKKKSAQPATA